MKKFTILIVLLLLCGGAKLAFSQCPFPSGVSLYGTGVASSSCNGVTTGTSTCHYFNEYASFTGLTIGNTYSMTVVNTAAGLPAGPYELGVFTSTSTGTAPLAYSSSATFPITVSFVATSTTVYTKSFVGTCVSSGNFCNYFTLTCTSCAPIPATFQPATTSVTQGAANVQVLRVDVPACTSSNTATSLTFSTTGSTNPVTDIVAARLYYTATTTFSTTTQFGTVVNNPNGTFTFTGSQTIPVGIGYFWLVYDLACNATVTNVIDAECTSVTTSSGTTSPPVPNPTGTRAITALPAATVSTVQSFTTGVVGGSTNNIALRVDIAGIPCIGNITQLNLTNVSTNLSDITKAKVYYTTTTTFSAAVQFGSDVLNPGATFAVNGSMALANTGTNYFWIVYELACSAPAAPGNVMDGGLTNAVTSGAGTLTPTTSNPTGTRTITAGTGAFLTISNGDWSSPATWSCGNIPPLGTTAVTINNNVTVTTNVIAGDITVAAGASVTISAGSLTTGTSSAGSASGNSNRLMNVIGTLTISGGTLNINGGLTLATGSFFNMSSGTLNIDPNDGTATSYTTTSAFLISTPNLNVTGGNINILDPSYSTVAGAGQRSIAYSVTTTNAAFTGTSTVTFGGGDDTNVLNVAGFYIESIVGTGTLTINNLIHNGGNYASKRHASVNLGTGYATAVKNLTVNSGSEYYVPPTGGLLGISGNLVNNGVITSGATSASSFSTIAMVGNVTYTTGVTIGVGSLAQSISGTGYFKKSLTDLDPTAQTGNNIGTIMVFHTSSSPGVTLNMPLTATTGLRLLRGKINTTAANYLAVGHGTSLPGNPNVLTESNGTVLGFAATAAASTSVYDGGFINGPLKRWFSASTNIGQTGYLPVGFDTTNVAQILFTTAPANAGYITGRWIEGNSVLTFSPPINEPAVTPSAIDHYTSGLWEITADAGISGATYSATFTDSKLSGLNSFANTTLIKRANSAALWTIQGTHVPTTGSNVNPTLSRTGLTSFSQFTLGSGLGPLVACSGTPTGLSITGSTSSSGTISWTASTPVPTAGYDYYYSTSNVPPTVSTIPSGNTTSTTVTIGNLPPNTIYYFWVRSNCSYPDVSPWSSMISFQTNPGTGCFSIINSNISSICVGNNVILTATGGPWVSIQWFNPAGNPINGANTNTLSLPNIQANQSGLYSVQLVDMTACVANASYQVNVNALPVPTIGATPNPVCTGKTLNLSSGGGATYAWSGPLSFTSNLQNPTRANILATHAGTYVVTVTSAAGCSANASVSVTVNTSPIATINATPNPICTGNTLNLTSGGGTSYSWTGPASFTSNVQNPTRPNVLITHSGNYIVSVTSANGCSATNTVSVTVNASPTATASAAPAAVCVGDNINLKASGGTSYQWSGPAGFTSNSQNPIRGNAQTSFAGIYTVKVTSGNGCTATASVSVTVNAAPTTLPTATPSSACVGSTVQLTSGGGTSYAWTGPQGYTSNLQNPVLVITSHLQAGVYKVKVTNGSGCSATFSVTISVNYPPIATATYQSGTNCIGSNLKLFGNGAGSYLWSGPNGFTSTLQNPVINNVTTSNSGTYTLKVTSPNGCAATATLNIVIMAAPVATAFADQNNVCEGGTVYLHATGGSAYKWSGPAGWSSNLQNPIIYNIPGYMSGFYTVTVINAGGCTSTATVLINVSQFINGSVSASPNPAPSGSNVQLTATGGVFYQWSGPNGFNSTDQNPLLYKVSAKNAGRYVVIITNAGGCQLTLFLELTVISAKGKDVVVTKNTTVGELSTIYPNPAKNFIQIDYKGSMEIKYDIVNIHGEIVLKDARSQGSSINIESLSSGTYAIVWSENFDGAPKSVGKFIKVD